jgi:hypothetical protein
VFTVSVGMPKGKRPPKRHRRLWKNNIKKDLRNIFVGYELDSFGSRCRSLADFENTVMNTRVSQKFWNLLTT